MTGTAKPRELWSPADADQLVDMVNRGVEWTDVYAKWPTRDPKAIRKKYRAWSRRSQGQINHSEDEGLVDAGAEAIPGKPRSGTSEAQSENSGRKKHVLIQPANFKPINIQPKPPVLATEVADEMQRSTSPSTTDLITGDAEAIERMDRASAPPTFQNLPYPAYPDHNFLSVPTNITTDSEYERQKVVHLLSDTDEEERKRYADTTRQVERLRKQVAKKQRREQYERELAEIEELKRQLGS